MLRSQGSYILLNHARDYLRQHFAIDAGLDNMDHRPLGSDPSEVDEETRKECRERMGQIQERAHEEIAGLISGAKVDVWRESDSGEMQIAAPGYATNCFDGVDGLRADRLYFLVKDWKQLLAELASQESRDFFDREVGFVTKGEPILITLGRYKEPGEDFDWNAAVHPDPWWSVNQALCWIATECLPLVAHLKEVEAISDGSVKGYATLGQLLVLTARRFCRCGGKLGDDEMEYWERCGCVRDAGLKLLEAIRVREIVPLDRSARREMVFAEFANVGDAPSGKDWIELRPQPLFSSAELIEMFPARTGPGERATRSHKPSRAQRGRTKGTGYQHADAPLLKKMREAIANNPALNATSAAKLVANEAQGASFEAKVDRLSRAFRAGRNGE